MDPARRFRLESTGLFLAMALFVAVAGYGGWFVRADLAVHDLLVRAFPLPAADDVVIVGVDERSLAAHGLWPWDRALQGRLLEVVAAGRPRAALVDVVYAGQGDPAADAALVAAAGRLPVLALPIIIDALTTGGQLLEVLPYPDLLERAAVLGHVHVELDGDAVVRGTYLHQGVGSAHWPHVALALAEFLGEAPTPEAGCLPPAEPSLQNVRCNWVYLPFAGPPGTFAEVSAADLLDGTVSAALLEGRIVLLGVTASAASDRLPSPVSGDSRPLSGIELNANLLSAILQNGLIRQASPLWVAALTLLCIAMPALLLPRLQPKAMLAVASLGALVPLLLSVAAHLAWQLHLPLAAAAVTALAAYPYWSWRRHEIAWHFVAGEMSRLSLERGRWPVAGGDGEGDAALQRLAGLLRAQRRFPEMPPSGAARLELDDGLVLERTEPFSIRERAFASHVVHALREDAPAEVLPGERLAAQIRSLERAARDVRLGRDVGRRSLAEMPNGVAVLSALGEVLFVNEAARQLLVLCDASAPTGYDGLLAGLVAPLGRSWGDVAAAVVVDRETVALETRNSLGASVLVDAAPLAGPGEPVDHWVITLTDMSDIRAAERDREEALAFLSHDLRSPMLSVLALVRDAEYSQVLADIGRYAEKALSASEQFLQLSRVQAREQFETYELNLLDVLHNAADGVFVLARERNVSLDLSALEKPEDGIWVLGNGELLERAFVNLLGNAIKYSDKGTKVWLEIATTTDGVAVTVVDQGLGIPEAEQVRVFEPFFRSASQELAARRGAGLGLRFVKTVVERHGGSVRLVSRPGAGSRFCVSLPVLDHHPAGRDLSE